MTLSQAYEALAVMEGTPNWNTLAETALRTSPYLASSTTNGSVTYFKKPGSVEEPTTVPTAAQAKKLSNVLRVIEVNLVDVLTEYDAPEETLEWRWIEANHSFAHCGNKEGLGAWEFMLHAASILEGGLSVPPVLKPFFERARAEGAIWVMFHQG